MQRGRQNPAASSNLKSKRTVKKTDRLIAQDDSQQPKQKRNKQAKKRNGNSKNDAEGNLSEISVEPRADVAQTSTQPKITKNEEIISAAKELEISLFDAEAEIEKMNAEPENLNRATVWAQVHAKNNIHYKRSFVFYIFAI